MRLIISIRSGRYKLIEYCVGDDRHTQLFDLVEDPQEIKNLADDKVHQEANVGMKGYIALQLHARDQLLIRFKDITVLPLTNK